MGVMMVESSDWLILPVNTALALAYMYPSLFHMLYETWFSSCIGRSEDPPITKLPTASLYSLHLSPTSFFSATYNGSRSILGGIFSVLLLIVFIAVLLGGGTILKLFGGKIGVLELILGRLKAAGSMSGILV